MFLFPLISTLFFLFIYSFYQKRCNYPPGPIPLPLLGNLLQLGWLVHKHGGVVGALKELKRVYGPIFTIWLGPQPTVHICSMELTQETMIRRGVEFGDRWAPDIFKFFTKNLGIGGTNGYHWVEQRRFALHTLRNFGVGRGIMEEKIMAELDMRTDELDANLSNGQTEIDANSFFELTVGSIINRILFSERFEKHHEKEFFRLKHATDEFNAKFSAVDFLFKYPLAHKVPYLHNRWTAMIEAQNNLRKFLQKQVRERMTAIETGEHVIVDEPEDYVDAFLAKMEEEKNNELSTYHEESLLSNLMDLWSAGQETTSATLLSGFYNLILNPEVMEKTREELLAVTKGERPLSLKDKGLTPYLNAVVTEIQRKACLVGINLFRQINESTIINGHPIIPGTALTAEISVLMNDDDLFIDCEKFNPSRYLENDALDQHVLPFGLGKRACPGESLARAELYLIIGNLLLRYKFEESPVEPLSHVTIKGSFFNAPPKYKMKLTKF